MNKQTLDTGSSKPTPQVTIVGLGLVGLSIGLGLKQTAGQQAIVIVGHDKNVAAADQARKVKAVDRTEWNLVSAIETANVVILDLPLSEIRPTLAAIAGELPPGCIVTDTASLKLPVLQAAAELLPAHVSFVGGHPVIAATDTSFYKATPTLFRQLPYCLTVAPATSPEATQVVSDLADRLGAKVLYLDAAEHDGLMASVETTPSILAAILLTVARGGAWKEISKVAGAQFDASTRLAAESAPALAQATLSNRDNVLRWLDLFSQELEAWRARIASAEAAELEGAFAHALAARNDWMSNRGKAPLLVDTPTLPEHPSIWMRMFGLGGRQLRGQEPEPPQKN